MHGRVSAVRDAPKDELARLLRVVDGTEMPSRSTVVTYDRENNLIRVRSDWWTKQSSQVQRLVWMNHEPYLFESDFLGATGEPLEDNF